MRDLATYEADACDAIEVDTMYQSLYNLVKQTKVKLNSLSGLNDQFLNNLMEKVGNGVNEIQETASNMKYSHHLIQTRRGIKRLDATKRVNAVKR